MSKELAEWIREFIGENELLDAAGFSPWEYDEESDCLVRRGWGQLKCKHPGYNGTFTIKDDDAD